MNNPDDIPEDIHSIILRCEKVIESNHTGKDLFQIQLAIVHLQTALDLVTNLSSGSLAAG